MFKCHSHYDDPFGFVNLERLLLFVHGQPNPHVMTAACDVILPLAVWIHFTSMHSFDIVRWGVQKIEDDRREEKLVHTKSPAHKLLLLCTSFGISIDGIPFFLFSTTFLLLSLHSSCEIMFIDNDTRHVC